MNELLLVGTASGFPLLLNFTASLFWSGWLSMIVTVIYIYMGFYRLYRMSRRSNATTQSRQVEASCPCLEMPDKGKDNRKMPPPDRGKQIDRLLHPSQPCSSSAICARRSSRSLFSHSEASLSASSSTSATGGPVVLPTSVVARKSKVVLLHRSSAKSSTTLVRSLPWTGLGSFQDGSPEGRLLFRRAHHAVC